MRIKLFVFLAAIFAQLYSVAQLPVKEPDGGGAYEAMSTLSDELTPQQRKRIVDMLQTSELQLKRQGKIAEARLQPATTLFSWPVKQVSTAPDSGFYGISNYVDENAAYPNAVLDYNCGNRTYDLSSGYNHGGTDIFIWPFAWQKMKQNAVAIVAAAPGVIIAKTDNNSDTSCSFCTTCDWNAVYIRHADGSVAWYGHMKKNSQTGKAVGQTVAEGEFLGIVGSSGSSTGPHLHFEVYANSTYTQLIDPWAGPCNAHNGNVSWWANQEPYRVSTLNKVMTHGAPPVQGCYSEEALNSKTDFVNGDILYLGTYYRDQLSGQRSVHTLYGPDNSVQSLWVQVFGNTFNASWWYYTLTIPGNAPAGTWRYEVTYNDSRPVSTFFTVNSKLPVQVRNFIAIKSDRKVAIKFNTVLKTTILPYHLLRSSDGVHFEQIKSIPPKNVPANSYATTDDAPLTGANYYKLEITGKDGSKNYSDVQKVIFNEPKSNFYVIGNPFRDVLRVTVPQAVSSVTFEILNLNGQLVYRKQFGSVQGNLSLDLKLSSGVYLLVMKSHGVLVDKRTVIRQ